MWIAALNVICFVSQVLAFIAVTAHEVIRAKWKAEQRLQIKTTKRPLKYWINHFGILQYILSFGREWFPTKQQFLYSCDNWQVRPDEYRNQRPWGEQEGKEEMEECCNELSTQPWGRGEFGRMVGCCMVCHLWAFNGRVWYGMVWYGILHPRTCQLGPGKN